MTLVLNKDGHPLSETTRNGKVRRLLKEKKARVVSNDPFIIQLLYEEDKVMNIIVTNKLYMPYKVKNATKMGFSEFRIKLRDSKLDIEAVYHLDIDDIDKTMYNEIKTHNELKVNFFRFCTDKKFIEEPILSYKPINNVIDDDLVSINFSDKVAIQGHILAGGFPGSGKTTLCTNIYKQLLDKNIDVKFLSTKDTSFNDGVIKAIPIAEAASIIEEAQREMMNRFKVMEQNQVNHISKVPNPPKPLTIIIDDIWSYSTDNDYKSVDIFNRSLRSIVRLGRAVCVRLIITTQRMNSVGIDIYDNMPNKIYLSNFQDEEEDSLNIELLPGTGILCENGNKILFSIDAIKNL